MSLQILFDHAQKRAVDDRIGLLAGGDDLNGDLWSNVWLDPITRTLMLRPGPMDAAWYTSNSGLYAKLAKSAFTFVTSGSWQEIERFPGAGVFLTSQGVNEVVKTTSTYGLNRAMWISWYAYGSGDNFVQMGCGWSDTADATAGVALRFYSGGDVEIWRGGVLRGVRKISGGNSAASTADSPIGVLIIPCRRRELLVVSTTGDGFSWVFDEIDEDEAAPEIVPDEKFWFNVPEGKATVQVAPLTFPTSGYGTSLLYEMSEAPVLADTYEDWDNDAWAGGADQVYKILGDPSYVPTEATSATAGLVVYNDAGTVFTPDGTENRCRIRVNLATTNANYTPFVYGAQIGFERTVDATDDDPIEAQDYCLSATLDVPENPADVSLDLVFKAPDALEADGVDFLLAIANRACALDVGGIRFLDGFSEPAHWSESVEDETRTVRLSVRDRFKPLEGYMFRERVALDGLPLEEAIEFVLRRVGLEDATEDPPGDYDLDATSLDLGKTPDRSSGEFGVEVQIGDSAADWVRSLVEDYAATWFYGFVPTADGVQFKFTDPANLPDEASPAFTLHPLADDSVETPVWRGVYWSYDQNRLDPEANEVRVTWYDPRLRQAHAVVKVDAAAQNPTTAKASRPDNWLGEPRRYGLIDPRITSEALADFACETLYDRLTPRRTLAEWQCALMLRSDDAPVWRGDVVRLVDKGYFRVTALSIKWVLADDDATWYVEQCRYVGEKIAEEPEE